MNGIARRICVAASFSAMWSAAACSSGPTVTGSPDQFDDPSGDIHLAAGSRAPLCCSNGSITPGCVESRMASWGQSSWESFYSSAYDSCVKEDPWQPLSSIQSCAASAASSEMNPIYSSFYSENQCSLNEACCVVTT
jgi:hypothetical protein